MISTAEDAEMWEMIRSAQYSQVDSTTAKDFNQGARAVSERYTHDPKALPLSDSRQPLREDHTSHRTRYPIPEDGRAK